MDAPFELNADKFIQENITTLVCKTCTRTWTKKWTGPKAYPARKKALKVIPFPLPHTKIYSMVFTLSDS
jgi:hypothetical protein